MAAIIKCERVLPAGTSNLKVRTGMGGRHSLTIVQVRQKSKCGISSGE